MNRLVLSIAALSIVGCTHQFSIVDAESRVEGEIGVFSSNVRSTESDQKQKCLARTGAVPGVEELCNDQVRGDMERRERVLDWRSTPYYAPSPGYPYVPPR